MAASAEYIPLVLAIERIEALLALTRAAAGSAIAGIGFGASTVVWRPGGVSAGNVFATWPEVVAQVAKMNGEITIAVDATIVPVPVIPAGAWDLRPPGVTGPVFLVNGTPGNVDPFITIANAPVTINGLTGIRDLQIDNNSTSNVISSTASQLNFYLEGTASIYNSVSTAGAAFLSGSFRLYMRDFSFISTLDVGTNAIQVPAVNQLILILESSATLDRNQLSVAPGSFAIVNVSGSAVPFSDPPYQPQASAPATVPQGMRFSGSTAIDPVTGKTPVIGTTFITTATRIECTQRAPGPGVGDAGTVRYAALLADRVNGNGTGSFQISALSNVGGGAVNLGDPSVVDWEVIIFG
jgi:hypothetical protein